MAFERFNLCSSVIVKFVHLQVLSTADKHATLRMKAGTIHLCWHCEFLELRQLFAIPESDDVRMCGRDDIPVLRDFHGTGDRREVEPLHFLARASFPDSERLVVRATDQGGIVLKEGHMPDTARVAGEDLGRGFWFVQIINPNKLLVGRRAEEVRVGAEVHGLYDVLVLKRMYFFALYCIPDLRIEIRRACRCPGRLRV